MTQERNTLDTGHYEQRPEVRLGAPSEHTELRMGLAVLRLQDLDKAAECFDSSIHQVTAAWEHCRDRLSRYFAAVEGRAHYSMDDHELGARRNACVAFLEECVQQHNSERYRARLDS